MKIFKKNIIKILSTILLTVGVGAFILALPKIFVILAAYAIESMGGLPTEEKMDENGNVIHQDWRKTITSFGSRKQFAIEKGFWTEDNGKEHRTWDLFDRDKNNCIDEIRFFTRSSSSPCVYSLGEKGYTKLNYETGEIIQSKNINDFQGDDKTVFEKLEITKSEAEDDQEKFEVSWEWIFS